MKKQALKIGIASDLHLEFYTDWRSQLPVFEKDCDLIVLAGDIINGRMPLDCIREIAQLHPNADIVYVAGNHEFYGADYREHLKVLTSEFSKDPHIHFLENKAVNIKGYTILGCTLWTGFDILGDHLTDISQSMCKNMIRDFDVINDGVALMEPQTLAAIYAESRQWLDEQLGQLDCSKTIVVSHFPPCLETTHPGFEQGALTPYFQANCIELIEKHHPTLWVYGHNHWSQDTRIGKTRLISNQRGYPGEEDSIPQFRLTAIME